MNLIVLYLSPAYKDVTRDDAERIAETKIMRGDVIGALPWILRLGYA